MRYLLAIWILLKRLERAARPWYTLGLSVAWRNERPEPTLIAIAWGAAGFPTGAALASNLGYGFDPGGAGVWFTIGGGAVCALIPIAVAGSSTATGSIRAAWWDALGEATERIDADERQRAQSGDISLAEEP